MLIFLKAWIMRKTLALEEIPLRETLGASLWSLAFGVPLIFVLMIFYMIISILLVSLAYPETTQTFSMETYFHKFIGLSVLVLYVKSHLFKGFVGLMLLILHLIPAFYVSVSIEQWAMKKRMPDQDPANVAAAIRRANIASYGVIMAGLFVLLAIELIKN